MKILLPVDGSECTRRMVAYIGAHDEMFGPSHDYAMLLAVGPMPANVAGLMDPVAFDEYCANEIERVFGPLRSFATQNGWRVRFETVQGDAGPAIPEFARRDGTDLIVMGSHGRSALTNIVMGSVTTSVLAHGKTPVLVIR